LLFSSAIKTIRDPIHDYIAVGDHEISVIDSPFFQRLRRIKQLQTAYLVYPGAEHSRLQHSLGVMHLAGQFAMSIIRNTVSNRGVDVSDLYIVPKMYNLEIDDFGELLSHILSVRIAGLIHDIGHGPYSHAFDESIVSQSDDLKKRGISSHEDLGFKILTDYLLDAIIKSLDHLRTKIPIHVDTFKECLLYMMSPRKDRSKFKKTKLCQGLFHIVREFIYPADILDFTIRDAYYSGAKEFGMVDANRLMRYSVLIMDKIGGRDIWISPFDNALNTLRAFLYSRFWLFNNVYFHKVSRIFDIVVKNTLRELNKCIGLETALLNLIEGDPTDFLLLDDLGILHMAKRCKEAWKWASMILDRKLPYKEIYSGELHLRRKEEVSQEELRKEVPEPEIIVNEISESVSELLGVNSQDIVIDYPNVRFFPDNPYLSYGSLILLEKRGENTIVHKHVSINNIIFGSTLDVTVLRIFLDRETYKKLGESKVSSVRKHLEESGLMEKFNRSLIVHWGASAIGVTM